MSKEWNEGYEVGFGAGIATAEAVVDKYDDKRKIKRILTEIFLAGPVKEENPSPCATCGLTSSDKAACCGCEDYFKWRKKNNEKSNQSK